MSYKKSLEVITRSDSAGLRVVASEIGERADKEIASLKDQIIVLKAALRTCANTAQGVLNQYSKIEGE